MNKKRLIAYTLAITSLLGCNKQKNEIETTQTIETTQIIEKAQTIPQETTQEIETTKAIKHEIAKYAFAKCDITINDEQNNTVKQINQYDPLTILGYDEKEEGITEVVLEDGTFTYIDYTLLEVLPETYVEVDISKQKLYCYYNDELVLIADVVTGNPTIGTTPGTNLGYTQTNGKLYKTYLMGNAYVDIFISFNPDGEGFHNAPWRQEFGGEIYKTNGSHGCVNMKYEDVVILDKYTQNTGTKVLIHR